MAIFHKIITLFEPTDRYYFHTTMLSISTFNRSTFDIQKEQTFESGEFFDVNSSGDRLISLYYYNGYLIEVYFNPYINEVERFYALSLWDAADKYIDLTELFVEV